MQNYSFYVFNAIHNFFHQDFNNKADSIFNLEILRYSSWKLTCKINGEKG